MKRRIIVILMSVCLLFNNMGMTSLAAENEEGAVSEELLYAKVNDYEISLPTDADTQFAHAWWNYFADTPQIVSFFDYVGNYNIIYEANDDSGLNIQRYNSQMEYLDTLSLDMKYPLWGNATCDSDGNYYIIWAQCDTDASDAVVTSVAKYDYNGEFLGECAITGYNSNPYSAPYAPGNSWGTQYPFDAGNCDVTIQDGILACNYARQMYSGHQSNYIFYVDCSTMTRVSPYNDFQTVPYCSHSFDQRIIATSDGGYLVANHGDASNRGFLLSKVEADKSISGELVSFHFREGADRSYGYNETYAQLGNIVEISNAYVLCASSERTLSLDVAATGGEYCGHNEARDLFVQFLKKDFYNYSGAEQYVVSGEMRVAEGEQPESANTNLYLYGNEVDYGVVWLTDYEDTHYVNNPQMVQTDDNRLVVLWEKLSYSTHEGETYYAILGEDGSILKQPMMLKDVYLTSNINPIYLDGKVYWTTRDTYGTGIHCLEIDGEPMVGIESADISLSRDTFVYDGLPKEPDVTVKKDGINLIENTDYTVAYSNNINEGEATVIVTGKGKYAGSVEKSFTINYAAPIITRTGDTVTISANFSENASGMAIIVYTTDGSTPSATNGMRFYYGYEGTYVQLNAFVGYLKAIVLDWNDQEVSDMSQLTLLGVTLDKSELELQVGEADTLKASVLPEDAVDKSVLWSTSNEDVATVDDNGMVTAVSAGEAIITATVQDGSNVSASCTVTVEKADGSGNGDNPTLDPVGNPFADVPESEWYCKYVMFVYNNNLMSGKGETDDGTKLLFDPGKTITRAEFVRILYNKEKTPAVNYSPVFTDVPEGTWYTNAILWAYDKGIVSGKGEGIFDVNGEITRLEIAQILYKYAVYKGYDITTNAAHDLSGFVDADTVVTWGQKAMKWAIGYEIVTGKDTEGGKTIAPDGSAIRVEAATMVYKVMAAYEGATLE